jgi:hypothetical protein
MPDAAVLLAPNASDANVTVDVDGGSIARAKSLLTLRNALDAKEDAAGK